MTEWVDIHPTVNLDPLVERKNESHHHWAIKAAIVSILRSNPELVGEIETERKTGERIADIRCCLSDSPPDFPRRFAIEIETPASNKDRFQATRDHLVYGHSVYWVFTVDAIENRRTTENLLSEYLSSPPSLGVAALSDGELSLGSPITWDDFAYEPPWLARSEIYIPTYDRYKDWYCHGDFRFDDERVSIIRKPRRKELYISRYTKGGQQTLPQPSALSMEELLQRIDDGTIERESPVRGPP